MEKDNNNTFADYTDEEIIAWLENDYNPDGSDDYLYQDAKEELYRRGLIT